jgi:hypothetical protein
MKFSGQQLNTRMALSGVSEGTHLNAPVCKGPPYERKCEPLPP